MKKINWKVLIISLVIVFLIAALGSIFTSSSVNSSWYSDNKPSFTPPSWLFGPVWTILYIMIAFSLYFVWIKANANQKKKIALIFGANLLLNMFWSWLFFGLQNPILAFFDILLILSTIVAMIMVTRDIEIKSALLLLPYLIWVCFATLLNFAFAI